MDRIMASLRVGTGLRYWRGRHDPPLTAAEVAEGLRVAKSTYALIEQGRLLPTQRAAEELCRILGVPMGALFVPEVVELILVYGVVGDPLRHLEESRGPAG